MQAMLAAEINSRSIIPNGRVLRVDPLSREPYKGAGDAESRTLSRPASHRTAGIVDAETAAQLSVEFVPEHVGARVGGHLVDFDRDAVGVERDPADFDDRGPGRDLKAVRLGWQWHPGADVLPESRGGAAEVGEAGVDAAGAGLGPGDWGTRGDGGRKPAIRRVLNRTRSRAVAQGETYPKLGADTGR
jgi:hypothetical protein